MIESPNLRIRYGQERAGRALPGSDTGSAGQLIPQLRPGPAVGDCT